MDNDAKYMKQGIDSKALLTTVIMKIPILLIVAVTGAVVGSGLNLVIGLIHSKDVRFVSETEYYIEFAPGRYEASDYYNAYTWNDVVGTDLILGNMMDTLGNGFDRAEVKEMITAEILSDVRYLKITIKSDNEQDIGIVESALQKALAEFGDRMDEFTSIYKINDTGISQEKVTYFTLRAALLGAFVFGIIALFIIVFRFCIGSSFYTKRDISNTFDIPVYGIFFENGGYEGVIDLPTVRYNEMFFADEQNKDELVAIIPFGKPYREKIADEIYDMKLKGMKIKGAVLTGANKQWYKIYRG